MLSPMQNFPFNPVLWHAEPHDFTKQDGDHNLQLGVYTAETTQRYIPGTRSMTWDGRVYRYAKCGGYDIPNNKYGIKNNTILVACKTASGNNNAVTLPDAVVGDTSFVCTFTAATLGNSSSIDPTAGTGRTGILTEHELCGGYISFYTGDYRQQRGIVGNSAVAVDGTSMTIYLDAPLDHVLTASTSTCEILANPYGCVGEESNDQASHVGVSNVTADIGDFIWLQTWGPLRISPTHGNPGGVSCERQFVFFTNGAIIPSTESTTAYAYQHAGFIIEKTYDLTLSAAPFIMLQVSP